MIALTSKPTNHFSHTVPIILPPLLLKVLWQDWFPLFVGAMTAVARTIPAPAGMFTMQTCCL